jgi:hypothetical protein
MLPASVVFMTGSHNHSSQADDKRSREFIKHVHAVELQRTFLDFAGSQV